METYLNRNRVEHVDVITGRYRGKRIAISVDSSKTNTAIYVMNGQTYKGLDVFEFSGDKVKDVLELIKDQREMMSKIFDGAIITDFGIEDIITRKEGKQGTGRNGLDYHHSRYVITAVFISIIVWLQDTFNIQPGLIPNQSWKAAILPEELNKRGVYKGSVEYVKGIHPEWIINGTKNDDVADAVCIGIYMKLRAGLTIDSEVEEVPSYKEYKKNNFKCMLYPIDLKFGDKKNIQFFIDYEFESLEEVAIKIANRLEVGTYGWAEIPISKVNIEDIYLMCRGKYKEKASSLLLVVNLCK